MTPHRFSLVGQVKMLLAHTSGVEHVLLLIAVYAVLVTILWRVWLKFEDTIGRLWIGRWCFQESTGEWHRVIHTGEHGDIIDVQGRERRYVKAIMARDERRREMLVAAGIVGVSVWFCFSEYRHPYLLFWRQGGDQQQMFAFIITSLAVAMAALCAVIFSIMLIADGFKHLLYLSGNQHIDAPRVIDPPPVARPGREVLENEPAYETGGPASMADIDAALGGKTGGEPEQRFED